MTDEEFEQSVNELWEWACAVLPVFGDGLFEAWNGTRYLDELEDYDEDGGTSVMERMLVAILTDPHHEDRLTLAMDACYMGNEDRQRYFNTELEERFKDYIRDLWRECNSQTGE